MAVYKEINKTIYEKEERMHSFGAEFAFFFPDNLVKFTAIATQREIAVFMFMLKNAEKFNHVFMSVNEIASGTGIAASNVSKILRRLEEVEAVSQYRRITDATRVRGIYEVNKLIAWKGSMAEFNDVIGARTDAFFVDTPTFGKVFDAEMYRAWLERKRKKAVDKASAT